MADLLKLNLGCGADVRDDWLNYDAALALEGQDGIIHWKAGQPLTLPDRRCLPDESVERIDAIHLIEHIPHSDDEQLWFGFWEECWRVLAPDGVLHVEVPWGNNPWVWGDPGHHRAINLECFVWLSAEDVMKAAARERSIMSGYRPKCNFGWAVGFDHCFAETPVGQNDTLFADFHKKPLPEGYLEETG